MEYLLPDELKEGSSVGRIVPAELSKLRIRYAKPRWAEGNFGSYLTQEYNWNGLGFDISYFFITRDSLLIPYTRKPEIDLQFMLKGSVEAELNGAAGKFNIKENVYQLFYVSPGKHKAWFTPGDYTSFYIRFTPGWLKQLSRQYPAVRDIVQRARRKQSNGIQYAQAKITSRIRKLIHAITNCPDPSPERELYIESRIKIILSIYARVLMENKMKDETTGQPESLNTIVKFIDGNISSKITAAGLSKRFRITQQKLQKLFMMQFNRTVHAYINHERLLKAKVLFETTTLTSETIAFQTGYTDHSHLNRQFKKHFGYGPDKLRIRRNT